VGEYNIKDTTLGPLVQKMGEFFGWPVNDKINARVIANITYEESITADIQLAYEMAQSECKS
jgi:hypothetical protein